MLRGEEQQEEEGQVGRRVADELDEGLADEEAVAALGGEEVADGEDGEQQTDEDAGEELARPVAPAPARELVVPPRRQQLLAVGLGHELEGERGGNVTGTGTETPPSHAQLR